MSIARCSIRGVLGVVALAVACLLAGCDDVSSPGVDAGASADAAGVDASLSTTDTAEAWATSVGIPRRHVAATFYGVADPATGEFVVEQVLPTEASSGLRSVQQASWCSAFVEQDGIEGVGFPNTLELFTVAGSVESSLPGEPTAPGCVDDVLEASRPTYDALYPIDGVFCAEVGVRSFYDTPLQNLHAEILYTGEAGNAPWQYPYGNGADPDILPGSNAPSAADGGLFRYGSLGEAGTPTDNTTTLWTFKNQSDAPFEFNGEVVHFVQEICGNEIDDDCDGIVDNGCRDFGAGADCVEDADCVSESCTAGVCDPGCGSGRYGDDCDPCPGGVLNPCNGNGTCDDGVDGLGACTCATGYTGDACNACASEYYGATPVLVISDHSTADEALATALTNAGYAVTRRTSAFNEDTEITDFGSLDGFAAVFWSATGGGYGDEHAADTFVPLQTFAEAGGYVMVVGYDTVASPEDIHLITFLGGTGSRDSGMTVAITADENALTTGVQDVAGLTPSGLSGDRDRLTGLLDDVTVVQGTGDEASITLRAVGTGYVAYLSNGNSGTSTTSSWTTVADDNSGAVNAMVRNFAYNAAETWSGRSGCVACDCGDGFCDDGIDGDGSCTCPVGFTGAGCDACDEGYFGDDCEACIACGDNGACDDGIDGEGVCICDDGFHGVTCGATCSDGLRNGDEVAADCGGVCSAATGSDAIGVNLRPEPANSLSLGDDGVSAALPIGFDFTFYGEDYSEAYVSSNGFLTFSNQGSGCCSGQEIPDDSGPNGVIALFWTDLNQSSGGTIRYGTRGVAPNREFVVSFNDVPHFGGGGSPVTGQIVLLEDGDQIEIICETCVGDGGTITQGVEGPSGADAWVVDGRNATSFTASDTASLIRTTGCDVSGLGGACVTGADCNFGLSCDAGTCACGVGFAGAACDICDDGYYGDACSACPGGAASPCSGNGTCDDGIDGEGTCDCADGFAGPDCSLKFFEPFTSGAGTFALVDWFWADGAVGNPDYANNLFATATSPVLDCGDEGDDMVVSFNLTGETEGCCDDVDLQRSLDGGSTWTTVATWRGTMPGAVSQTIAGSAGVDSVRMRIVLDSDGSVNRDDGPTIDDFGTSCPASEGPAYVYFEDFGDGDHGAVLDGWSVSGGTASYSSYPNNADDALQLPMLDCTDAGSDMQIAFDLSGVTERCCDRVHLEFSTDGGSSWTWHATYAGSLPGESTATLSGTSGESDVRVRFRLTSDSSFRAAGPVLDDIQATCDVGVRTPVYTEDFADAAHGFDLGGNWAVTGGVLVNDYDNSVEEFATSPVFDCTDEVYEPQVTFDLDGITEGCCDDVFVQSSIDEGATWTTIGEFAGLFAGTQRVLAVADGAGESDVRLRFVMESDGSVTYSGPEIDDFGITCELAPEPPAWEDDFADGSAGWTLTGWSIDSATLAYPWYPNRANASAISPTFDCTDAGGNMTLSFDLTGSTEACCDTLYLERSIDGGSSWFVVDWWRGSMPGPGQSVTLASTSGEADVRFRTRLLTDGAFNSPGPRFDNFEGSCELAPEIPYEEDFDDGAGLWTTGGWNAVGGQLSQLSYANNLNISAVSPTFDCSDVGADMVFGFDLTGRTENGFDRVYLERSLDGGSTWTAIRNYTDAMPGEGQEVTVAGSDGQDDVMIRFRLYTDGFVSSSGPRIDNVTATCEAIVPPAYSEDFDGGAGNWTIGAWTASGGDVNYPFYPNNANASAVSPTLDCGDEASNAEITFDLLGSTESCCDTVYLERSLDGASWTIVNSWRGTMPGADQTATLSGTAGEETVSFRFRLQTDFSVNSAGPRFDNITATCPQATAADSHSQDFSSALGWTTTGTWSISGGNLNNDYNSFAYDTAVSPVLNCASRGSDMEVSFSITGTTEYYFDYVYLQRSLDAGATWATVASSSWTGSMPGSVTRTIAGSAGDSDVRIRFLLTSDGSVTTSGPIVDDFTANCGVAP